MVKPGDRAATERLAEAEGTLPLESVLTVARVLSTVMTEETQPEVAQAVEAEPEAQALMVRQMLAARAALVSQARFEMD